MKCTLNISIDFFQDDAECPEDLEFPTPYDAAIFLLGEVKYRVGHMAATVTKEELVESQ